LFFIFIIYFIFILLLLFFDNLFKGLFANYTSSLSAVFLDGCNSSSPNGHKICNCSLESLRGTSEWPGSIAICDANSRYNITNCFFRNISSSYNNPRGGAVNCDMRNNNNYGYFNISGNTFTEIKTNKSVIQLSGNFSSLIFSSNSFYNVSSVYQGGV
jgi:hypothetical protein